MLKKKDSKKRSFSLADLAQQMVGGFLLSGPFVVTEEVWMLSANIDWYHSFFATLLVFGIGYGALYKADEKRNLEEEREVSGVPLRFLSLMLVAYLSVSVLILIFGASSSFEASFFTTLKVVSIVSLFSVIGAATADSVF